MIVNGLTELEDLEDLIPVTFDKEDYRDTEWISDR